MTWREHTIRMQDDLALSVRDYGARTSPLTPVLCLPGLTRNSKDFEALALRLSQTRRVISPDLRGRGRSAHDPSVQNYAIPVETADVLAVMAALGTPEVIVIGTSRGGLIAGAMAVTRAAAVKGVVLNDVGPELAPAGVARILSYVGRMAPPATWEEAAAALKALNTPMFALEEAGWMHFARMTFRDDGGRPALDYDPKIGEAIRAAAATGTAGGIDPWAVFKALSAFPLLLVRGANSDLLAPETVAKMREVKPDLAVVEVPGRGHAPFLDEPQAAEAIDGFLARIDAGAPVH